MDPTVPRSPRSPGEDSSSRIATADRVDRRTLVDFLRPRHRGLLVTRRADGGPQLSPVTCGIDAEDRIVVSTYPARAKARNERRDGARRSARAQRGVGPGGRHREVWTSESVE